LVPLLHMPSKNIILLDISLAGHHLAFLRTFSKILLMQGHTVICIAPEVSKVADWVKKECNPATEKFSAFEYNYQPVRYTRYGKLNHTLTILQKWKADAALIRRIQVELHLQVDLVFFAWLDDQLASFVPPFVLDILFPFKWSGLYFHPYHLRREERILRTQAIWRDWDAIFLAKNCVAVTIHDQGIREGFEKRIRKPVMHFPETADDSPPEYEYYLAKEIREKAQGRIVVGIIGCESHKGTLTMVELVKLADPGKYYFVFLGTLPQHTYKPVDWERLQNFIQEKRENSFFRFEPITEGGPYNAVFCTFDIPFLVYDNFISSSNRLTKAAIFQRLVLASDNYCVGEDVKRYQLGEAIRPMQAEAALRGLEILTEKLKSKDLPYKQWQLYRDLNSEAKLYERFAELTGLL